MSTNETASEQPMKDYMVEFYDFNDKRQMAMVSGTDEVNACENAESDYAESLAQISRVVTAEQYVEEKVRRSREMARQRHRDAQSSNGLVM